MKKIIPSLIIAAAIAVCFGSCQRTQGASESNSPVVIHKVTYHPNGGILSMVNSPFVLSVFNGDKLIFPESPVRAGYSFEGWFTDDGTFTNVHDFSAPITTSMNLYAKWVELIMPEMVWVPGGKFLMGSDDLIDIEARPVHQVTISGFYMSKYEITQPLYSAVTGFNPSQFQGNLTPRHRDYIRADLPMSVTTNEKLPVEQLCWYEAVEFCNKLSEMEGYTPVYTINKRIPQGGYPILYAEVDANWNANGYRLPTEAEWEYAAKGGNGMGPYFTYSGSNDPSEVGWYNYIADSWHENQQEFLAENMGHESTWLHIVTGHYWGLEDLIHPVGGKAPNSLGFYDMSGNVWEWCWDWYGDYTSAPQTNPKGPSSGDYRVRRGGAISEYGVAATRIANRDYFVPFYRNNVMGIRVVRNGGSNS